MDSVISHSKFMWSVLLSVSLMFIGTLSDVGKITSSQNSFGNTLQNQFTTKNNTRIIVQKGGLAILPCVVKVNSPATVSWIRRKDFQLLTVGLSTHSSDKRFLVEHTRHMGHWSLRIKSVKEEDRGFYECQLSIYPTQSIFVELKIVEAIAEIASGPDMHIDEGSMLRLECKLKRATENPTFVFWYHYSKMVNYDTQGGYTVTSTPLNIPNIMNTSSKDRNSSLHLNANNGHIGNHLTSSINSYSHSPYLLTASTSILSIKEVHFHHAGNYTCAPSNARPASIMVHVHKGEKPAAMQHANRSIFDSDLNNNTISNNISFSNSGRIANSIWTLRLEFMLIFKFIYFSKSKLNLYVNIPICTFLFLVLHHKIKR